MSFHPPIHLIDSNLVSSQLLLSLLVGFLCNYIGTGNLGFTPTQVIGQLFSGSMFFRGFVHCGQRLFRVSLSIIFSSFSLVSSSAFFATTSAIANLPVLQFKSLAISLRVLCLSIESSLSIVDKLVLDAFELPILSSDIFSLPLSLKICALTWANSYLTKLQGGVLN